MRHILAILTPISLAIILLVAFFAFLENGRYEREQDSLQERLDAAIYHFEKEDRPRKSLEVYNHIIERYGNIEGAYHGKGKILNDLQWCDESVHHYEKYQKLFPSSERMKEGVEITWRCNSTGPGDADPMPGQ